MNQILHSEQLPWSPSPFWGTVTFPVSCALKLQVVTDFPFNQYGCSLLIPFGIPQKVVFKTLREIHFRQPVFLSG